MSRSGYYAASPPTLYAFTTAIVRPGGNAVLINPDNSKLRWVSIETAATARMAFAVEVAPEILAVDADSPALGLRAQGDLARSLIETGITPVIVASGRPGHRHVFARISDPTLLLRIKARARSAHYAEGSKRLDVRYAIRPPLAPHRLGLAPKLLFPPDVAIALGALRGLDLR